jgi:hypothetical protein
MIPWGMGHQRNDTPSQLQTDIKTLETELQALAAKSGLTIADLESLATDSQSIALAGFHFNGQTLNPVISELAMAVAGNALTTQANTEFTNLFSGSSVSSTVISTTFNDLVKAIGDSGVTTTDLTTVVNDEAAIKTDLSNLPGWSHRQESDGVLDLETGLSGGLSMETATFALPDIAVAASAIPISLGGASSLLGSLSYVGVVTNPVITSQTPSPSSGTSTSAFAQLKTEIQTLRTELQTLATKSGLTIADIESLTTDARSIAQARFHFNSQKLNTVISELATAIASQMSTSHAQTDFTNLFTGSNVSSTVISTTFSDLSKAITDSKVTSTDLTTVASDEAAIQTDLQNLHKSTGRGTHGSHSGHPIPIPIVHALPHPIVHIVKTLRNASKHKGK